MQQEYSFVISLPIHSWHFYFRVTLSFYSQLYQVLSKGPQQKPFKNNCNIPIGLLYWCDKKLIRNFLHQIFKKVVFKVHLFLETFSGLPFRVMFLVSINQHSRSNIYSKTPWKIAVINVIDHIFLTCLRPTSSEYLYLEIFEIILGNIFLFKHLRFHVKI